MGSNEFVVEVQQKWQNQMAEDFSTQNSELFDVIFEIDGKKLYAHKIRLSIISPTFKTMLSERWSSKNDAIKINTNSYENFKEFLTLIYLGECNLNDQNILAMLDMGEFYQIDYLKKICDQYLSKFEYTAENIFHFMEISNKYSMVQMKQSVQNYISKNFKKIVESDEFLKAEKCMIEELIQANIFVKSEELFQAVYQWSEYQAHQKQLSSTEDNFNLNDVIKTEITPFLRYFEFKEMNMTFLLTFVVKKGFIFSYDELSDILNNANPSEVKVKVTNSHGQSIIGSLLYGSHAIEIIKSLSSFQSSKYQYEYIYWKTTCKTFPSSPKFLKKRNGIQWFLIYFSDGDIALIHSTTLSEYAYIFAEMTVVEEDFSFTDNCKIEIE